MTAEAPPAVNPTPATPPDDLGIDRAFLMQMAQVPLFAAAWVLLAFLAHQAWAALAPNTLNYSSVVLICAGMVLAAVIDGWAFKVPNWLTLSLVVSGWALGALHTAGVAIDGDLAGPIGSGSIWAALLCTVIGFFLLFPLLAIAGMGQGDVKMLMGFGSWMGATFGGMTSVMMLIWAFCLGAIIGGVFGLVIMVVRRKFRTNLSNFRAIGGDLKALATQGPGVAVARSQSRRPGWDRLPYGIPLCVGFLGYLAYLWLNGTLPGMQ